MSPINELLTDPQMKDEVRTEILQQARTTLAGAKGPTYWRSLESLVSDNKVMTALKEEYPRQFAEWETLGRRDFLKLMGASLALAGFSACTKQPVEKIVPYVHPPEELIPGKPLQFATAISLGGFGMGVLVESHMGRPTKIEGNPDHPSSLGSTDALVQASILSLYDPERSQSVMESGKTSSWEAFVTAAGALMAAQKQHAGAGIRILSETVTSPTLASLIQEFLAQYPSAVWHQYEPVNRDHSFDGSVLAFGEAVETTYRFDLADVVVSLDSDFMSWGAGRVRYARDFSSRRQISNTNPNLNRLYVAETMPSCTGSVADHRLPLSPSDLEVFVRAIGKGLGISMSNDESTLHAHSEWIAAVVEDLKQNRGKSIVVAGETLSPAAHALVHLINETLENNGKTVIHTEAVESKPVNQAASLKDLVSAMNAGTVDALVVLGSNPVYTAPADLAFAQALSKVKTTIHLGQSIDETGSVATWHLPEAASLETWGDIRAHDGTVTIMQPLIEPLYHGKSAIELLAVLLGKDKTSGYDLLRAYWTTQSLSANFESFWRTALHNGFLPDSAAKEKSLAVNVQAVTSVTTPVAATGTQISFRPDSSSWDGRFATNAWLQEAPRPITKLVWDNAALMAPSLATSLSVENGDVVTVSVAGRSVEAPVWIQPGLSANTVVINLGYGRRKADGEPLHVGYGRTTPDTNPLHVVYGAEGPLSGGFNAYTLRAADALWTTSGATIAKTGRKHLLVTTQDHDKMEGRHQIREATVAQFAAEPDFVKHGAEFGENPVSQLKPFSYEDGNQWAMTINLNACIGCNACLVSCQSENNIPVVGKDQVANGREMHWIRIDRYFEGDSENPSLHSQPVPCMHCENAPCELVCPVAATTHDNEGLNQMVYNRCVGTRYCSNNCPYKVRRFNYYKFSEMAGQDAPVFSLQRNPDVTVRARGVMEKCTYCTQRISEARIAAKKEDRPIRDGEVVTACQQACPTRAIVFGNINDPASEITKSKASVLNYSLLSELSTRPRTTYLAKVRNPNPRLAVAAAEEAPHHHGDA